MVRLLPASVAATTLLILVDASVPMSLIMALHLANFFLAAMVCHGELADDRPHAEHLTEFYLWVAVGGVLGGLVNGLLAPSILNRVLEYPAAIVAAAACRRVAGEPRAPRRSDWVFATAILVVTAASVAAAHALHFDSESRLFGLVFALPLLVTYGQLQRPARFALSILAMLLGGAAFEAADGRTIHVERGFFGVVRVTRDDAGRFTQIMNGNTIHGRQRRGPERDEPTSYYTRQGPAGQVFEALHAQGGALVGRPQAVAVLGLGAGGLSAYARADEPWTFYEINPTVIAVAKDPRYFSFLQDAFGDSPRLTIVVGDARLRLAEAPVAAYDLLVIDAFSSDSIPVHLLTRQAVALYRSRLATDGLLAVHISNRYLDLAPVVGSLAADAGLAALVREDTEAGAGAEETGWTPSIWAVMAPPDRLPEVLTRDPRWQPLRSSQRPWTDDFSNVLGAIRR
jgi:hypothetical protein